MSENAEAFHKNAAEKSADEAKRDSRIAALSQRTRDRESGRAAASQFQTMFEFDPTTRTLKWSDPKAASALFGVKNADAVSTLNDFDQRIDGDVDQTRVLAFSGAAQSYACEYRLRRENGERHWVEERGGWIGAGAGKRLISIVRSVEGAKKRERELAWLAKNDELTGLLNRSYLKRALSLHLKKIGNEGGAAAYLLAGIDDIGAVNTDFGFDSADTVIVEIAERLESVIGPNDSIGRVAGTKFGIIIADCDAARIRDISVSLLNVARESVIETQNGAVSASICIGSVELPDQTDSANSAMAQAEAALDAAKRMGKSSWSSFSEKTDTVSRRRRNTHISDVILTALNERRVKLAFQPIVSDLGEKPSKFECLIRLQGEDGQEIPAPEFIPSAERLGLVHLLDRRVLELATNTLAVCPDIRLAVNISMETVKDFVWAEGYIAHLRANPDLAKRITVELTETKVIDAIDASIEFVSEIKTLGCSFGIDDFGAGYTSFRNLKAMDIDILKIDGSFVTGVSASRENQLFVRTLLDLARNFGMQTVAEWVDNEADAMLLKGLGVDYLQGFLLGKPETDPAWLPGGAPNEAPRSLRMDRPTAL
ncbi:MAG: EAL domain-containing protein [Pseudomonadota bacterium]